MTRAASQHRNSGRRSRAWTHLCVVGLVWPLTIVAGTTVALMNLPYYAVALERAVQAAFAGTVLAAADLAVAGVIWIGCSLWIFRRYGREVEGRWPRRLRLGVEPLLLLAAVVWGVALWYPALLSQPVLAVLADLPAVAAVVVLLALVVAGALWTARPGRRLRLVATLCAIGVLAPVPLHLRAMAEGWRGAPPGLAVIGLDSISQVDPIEPLRDWTARHGGAWYERAVAPGLLTNAVWTSILTGQPVREHRVFHAFQALPARSTPLLGAARAAGYRTVAVFPDQLTSAPGDQADFDENRSGPIGWRQILLPIVANNSILVPLARPVLPAWWPSSFAANQAGTYTYDLRRDVRAVVLGARAGERTLVAAHLTYVHLQAYPRSLDMTWTERRRVAMTRAGAIRDRSFDWQDKDRPEDPIPLRQWKVARLQSVVAEEVDRSGLVDRGGILVLFSDHGDRGDLTADTFMKNRYHHVVLATFGVPARCPADPVSLVDIGSLAGLGTPRGEPDVEFVLAPPAMWPRLVSRARLQWSGQVELDRTLLDRIFSDLRRHRPWPDPAAPCPQ